MYGEHEPQPTPYLPWRRHDPSAEVEDGSEWLLAVNVNGTRWCLSVVAVQCDEDSFDVLEGGETWCWDWHDAEWAIPMSEVPMPPNEKEYDHVR
jgi:hypothetical protein